MKAPKKQRKDLDPIPQGNHIAVCDLICALGHQNRPAGLQEQIYIRFQLPMFPIQYKDRITGEDKEGPRVIGTFFNFSMYAGTGGPGSGSRLYQTVVSWRGRGFASQDEADDFDVAVLLARPAMVNVVHTPKEKGGGVWENITSITPLPEGMPVPEVSGEPLIYEGAKSGRETWERLPEWLQSKILKGVYPSVPEGVQADDGVPI